MAWCRTTRVHMRSFAFRQSADTGTGAPEGSSGLEQRANAILPNGRNFATSPARGGGAGDVPKLLDSKRSVGTVTRAWTRREKASPLGNAAVRARWAQARRA